MFLSLLLYLVSIAACAGPYVGYNLCNNDLGVPCFRNASGNYVVSFIMEHNRCVQFLDLSTKKSTFAEQNGNSFTLTFAEQKKLQLVCTPSPIFQLEGSLPSEPVDSFYLGSNTSTGNYPFVSAFTGFSLSTLYIIMGLPVQEVTIFHDGKTCGDAPIGLQVSASASTCEAMTEGKSCLQSIFKDQYYQSTCSSNLPYLDSIASTSDANTNLPPFVAEIWSFAQSIKNSFACIPHVFTRGFHGIRLKTLSWFSPVKSSPENKE